ncbi:MAG: WxcM-like domain-containing protein [Flavobacteriales bacterium]|nr:WxcM-like domain-containing protein [Flavobacteriales bacterium]MCB9447557.1 WxcM-like domain-containing protein [Flavobacteriales bacterium]
MIEQATKPTLIDLGAIGSPSLGYITVAECTSNVPFEIKRVYWTYYTPHNVTRGQHAHKRLQQVIAAVNGRIVFELETSSGETFRFELDSPQKGLYIPPGCWRNIVFSHDAVLLCLASEPFDEADYIRDYEDFKSFDFSRI